MLKKLLKYEWKDTRRLLLPINLAIVVFTLVGCVMLNTNLFDTELGVVLALCLTLFYTLTILVFSSITTIYIYVRFYKNLYTREGYLMHTLPVTATELFHSKLIVGCFWSALNVALTISSFMALGAAAGFHAAATEMPDELSSLDLPASIAEIFGYPLPFLLLWMLLLMIASAIFSVLMEYLSVLLGQQMKTNKLAASLVIYFGIYLVIQIVTSIGAMLPSFFITEEALETEALFSMVSQILRILFPSMSLFYLVLGIIFYLICRKLLKRSVNLD